MPKQTTPVISTPPAKFWDTFRLVTAHSHVHVHRYVSPRLHGARWHSPAIMEWLIIRKQMERTLPAYKRYRKLGETLTAITTIQEWKFCSNWERAVFNVPETVLRVFYQPVYQPTPGYTLPEEERDGANKYFSVVWNVLFYGDCYSRKR